MCAISVLYCILVLILHMPMTFYRLSITSKVKKKISSPFWNLHEQTPITTMVTMRRIR